MATASIDEHAPTGARLPGGGAGVRTARLALTVGIAANAVLLAVLMPLAVLVDRQSDILGARSEAHGGFDPSVFPPYSDGIWILANGGVGLAVVVLAVLISFRVLLRQRTPDPMRPRADPEDAARSVFVRGQG